MIAILKDKLNELNLDHEIALVATSPEILVFEERVALQCYTCARYNKVFTCPPRIPALNYQKLIGEYDNCVVAYCCMPFIKTNYSEVRANSTNLLHKVLIQLEDVLRDKNYPFAMSFIGGSCKLCKVGCHPEKCNNPTMARIPVEATGINLVKSLSKIGIHVEFPVTDKITRYGLLLW